MVSLLTILSFVCLNVCPHHCRLIADGTSNIVVLHDFSDPPSNPEDLRYDLRKGRRIIDDSDDGENDSDDI